MKITLRAARVNAGLTLIEASDALGINKDTLSRYQKDSTNIPRSLLISLVELYCVDANDIFFGLESDFFRKFQQVRKERSSHRVSLVT